MSQRITFTQMSTNVSQHLFDNYAKLDKTQQQLASGRRLNRPSDDPVGVATALQLRTNLGQIKQYERNIDDGLSYLATVDSVLQGGDELFQHLRDKAIQGSNDTLNSSNRKDIWHEARVVFDQMVSMANTTFKGEFIFSGTQTHTAPYDVRTGRETITNQLTGFTIGTPIQMTDLNIINASTATGIPNAEKVIPGSLTITGFTEGTDYTVDYNLGTITFIAPGAAALAQASGAGIDIGYEWLRRTEADIDNTISREIGENTKARINTTVNDAYGSPNENSAWDAMITLMEGLHLNSGSKIRESINKIDESLDRHLGAQSTNGSRVNQLEATQDRAATTTISLTDLQSKIEDVDFTEAITQMNMQQTVYNASLQVAARSIQSTLMNFL